jgi:succinate-semialdehyde dehydrogenase/glutarate-semialdehyde dehydrogenase
MIFQTVNPANNTVIINFEELTVADVEEAMTKALSTFSEWKKTNYKLRTQLLYQVAGLLRETKKNFAEMITLEMAIRHSNLKPKFTTVPFDSIN